MRAAGDPKSITVLLLVTLCTVIDTGCSRQSPAEQAAARFADTYYVEIDPRAALDLCTGEAREKLEKELQRLAGVGPADAAERPQIQAVQRKVRILKNSAEVTFEIQSIGDEVLLLTVDVGLRHEGERWVVTDFYERARQ